jgi:hypothetical protein
MERVKSESALPSFSRFVAQPEPKPRGPEASRQLLNTSLGAMTAKAMRKRMLS